MAKSDLLQGMEEVLAIARGEKKPSRITRYEIPDVKAIRKELNVSREEFAKAIGVSAELIKNWELRRRNPTGTVAKLLFILESNSHLYGELQKPRRKITIYK